MRLGSSVPRQAASGCPACAKLDALRKIHTEVLLDRVQSLTAENSKADRLESAAAVEEGIQTMAGIAVRRLEEFRRSLTAAREAEAALFDLLYVNPGGLRKAASQAAFARSGTRRKRVRCDMTFRK